MADRAGTRHYNRAGGGAGEGVSNIGGVCEVDTDGGVGGGAA